MVKQVHYLDYYNSLLEGNKNHCADIVRSLIEEGTDLKEIYTELFQKSLYQIGNMWDKSRLSIPEEHLATQITDSLISRFEPKPAHKNNQKRRNALVTCVDKEYHELGAKMVSNVFEMNGWKSYFLGASVPTKEILKYIKQTSPDVVAISFSLYINLLRFTELIDHIKKIYPDQKILVGGQAINDECKKIIKDFSFVIHLESIQELDSYLKSL